MNKERLFYYGTVLPLIGAVLYLYGEHKEQEQIAKDISRLCDRQIELINLEHKRRIDELTEKYEKNR
jgi:hypothetical protein